MTAEAVYILAGVFMTLTIDNNKSGEGNDKTTVNILESNQ